MGNFNEIRGNEEKQGGPSRLERSFIDSQRMISTWDFNDLKAVSNQFSLYGKRYSHDIRNCLD